VIASAWDEIRGSLRGPQVCRLAGVTYRKLDYWDRVGLVRPSIAEAKGSGSSRRYSPRDVLLVAVIEELSKVGVSLQSVRRHFGAIQNDLPDDPSAWSALIVVWTDTAMSIAASADELVRIVSAANGPLAVLPLAPVAERVAAALTELGVTTDREEGPATTGPSRKTSSDVSIAAAPAS
jgi:DNA-binding transcriptional MerR regulator